MANTTTITVRLEDEMLVKLDAICDQERRSRNFIVGEAVEQFIQRQSKEQADDK